MVEATLFIPLVIIAITQMIKMAFPQITGFLTIVTAFVVGIVVALIDRSIGVVDVTIAQGLVYALGAIGITAVAAKAGGGAKGDDNA
jgi:vacuolar-type H+-ATPase subunit I/STV1